MRAARIARGMTARELATAAGVGVSTVFAAEQDRHYPGVLVITACADVLGISLDDYIGRQIKKGT